MIAPWVLEVCCHERVQPLWLLLTERVPEGGGVEDWQGDWQGGRGVCTVYVVRNEFGSPPIVQRGEKGGKRQLSVDEVDDAELVVDVESAAIVLQNEALLRGGKGTASAGD